MQGKRRLSLPTAATMLILLVALVMALPGASADGGEDQVLPVPEKAELKYPNLGSRLDQLVARVEDGEFSAQGAAEDTVMHREESVAVTIYLSGNVEEVVQFLEDHGGDPRNTGEDYIEAYVPVSLLGPVSEQPGVIRVREIVPPEPEYGYFTSQGVQAHLAQAWHNAGYKGQGVKVGIIDSGFEGFRELMGTELPTTVLVRCYTDLGVSSRNLADCRHYRGNPTGVHGTASAETVVDFIPEASLYIANPRSYADMRDAVDWMISEGVSVINASRSWTFDGPGNGTSPYTTGLVNTVDRAVEAGIVWVNSAGNSAQHTWFGSYSNPDSDRWVNFLGSGERNYLTIHEGSSLQDYESLRFELRWEDSWVLEDGQIGGALSNLDLFVFDGATDTVVASSRDYQSGRPGEIPREFLWSRHFSEPPTGSSYYVAVSHEGGDAPEWIQLVLSHRGPTLHYHTLYGSIKNPAEGRNPGMLAVGAADWRDVRTIEPYSSRGPTPDGRFKPDIVGATCGESATYPGYCGTSGSSPHVAGLAALVRQRFPDYTPAQVAAYLKNHAQQRETPDPNNTWGHGFAQLPSPDRETLVALYNATGGANWTNNTNWLTNAPIGQWHGVTTDSQGRVTELNLTSNQLKGEIPPELANLTNLRMLALGGNELTGPIPTWLGGLTNLEELYLWENELTGTIPAELGSLVNLKELWLSNNQLSGEIPVELGSPSNLVQLVLWGNELTGEIPAELGSLTNLELLSLSANQLTGEIPAELGSLTNLQLLSLSANQLTGEIPAELGSLVNLKELWLSDNQLSGEIPVELGSPSNLVQLVLWGNELTGEIPAELGSLTNLELLSLSANELTGTIPAELGSLSNLQELWLSVNQLTGEIPVELGSLSSLVQLVLWVNELTGTIPAELGSLTNLEGLYLRGNQLTGEIPPELGSLANLKELWLSQNQLTGEIPVELGSLANLEGLYLHSNQLTGEIPPELGSLANLVELYLWGNQLTGMVPQTLVGLTMLERFTFHKNPGLCAPIDDAFQTWLGSISTVLGSSCALADSPEDRAVLVQVHSATGGANWTNNTNWLSEEHFIREWYGVTNDANGRVHGLALSVNQLTGEIPPELGSLANLEWLQLNNNQLTGTIPAELGNLTNLEGLYLSVNQLTGEIPPELGSLANLEWLQLNNNQLTGTIPAELATSPIWKDCTSRSTS